MEEVIFFKEFNVVNILERGVFTIWDKLEISKKVFLDLDDEDNKTIVVRFGDPILEGPIFGELPEQESEIIRKFLKQGWKGVFKAHICKIDKKALYDQRISIAVYIKNIETIATIGDIKQ